VCPGTAPAQRAWRAQMCRWRNGIAQPQDHSRGSVPVHPSDIAGCAAMDFPKAATEMRGVAEADVMGDLSYFPRAVLRLAKHAISAREAIVEKKSRKRGAVALCLFYGASRRSRRDYLWRPCRLELQD
jgi:hypothetical protein